MTEYRVPAKWERMLRAIHEQGFYDACIIASGRKATIHVADREWASPNTKAEARRLAGGSVPIVVHPRRRGALSLLEDAAPGAILFDGERVWTLADEQSQAVAA